MASNPDYLLNNEEFEKVDHDPDQDENITSTSLTGDMAEADRYNQGNAANDLLADFGGSDEFNMAHATSSSSNEPLISFVSSHPDPIPETDVKEVEPVSTTTEGCLFKNVDPRDDVMSCATTQSGSADAFGDASLPNIAESPHDCDTGHVFDGGKEISEITVAQNTEMAAVDNVHTTKEEDRTRDEEQEPDERLNERRSEKRKRASVILHQYAVKVLELVYWRDIKKTGIVFGSMMFVLISLACCSLMSVLAYLSLAVLTVTFSFRLYKNIMQAVQKTNDGHPFKKLMEMDIELKDEVIENAAENIANHVNNCCCELRRLYLVGDYIDSIKFGMLLWLMTYIGSWFNGITLVMLAVVSIFTIPKVYETYKVQIDSHVNMVRAQLNKVMAQITAKIPFPKKKPKMQ